LLRWPIASDSAVGGPIRVGPPERLNSSTIQDRWGSSADGNVIAIPAFSRGAYVLRRDVGGVQALGPQEDVRHCTVSPDGRWVATGSHGDIRGVGAKVWDAGSGRHVADLPVGGWCDPTFSPDGRWLLTNGGGVYRLWAVGTWREDKSLGDVGHGRGFAFTADGRLVALGDAAPGVVRLVAPDTGREVVRLTAPEASRLTPVAFTPDGAQLITIGGESVAVHLFDLRAIREGLVELGLDWDAPPLPPPSEAAGDPRSPGAVAPLAVRVDLGHFRERAEADRLVHEAGRLEREKRHNEALAALRRAVAVDPSHPEAHNNLAWLLLTGPEALRDPAEALRLARKAVDLNPERAIFLNTLGVALYRDVRHAEAVPVLQRSLGSGKGEADAFDLFFLAMARHRLGEAAAARADFARAVRWLDAHPTLDARWLAELRTFRAEAEAVLAGPAGELPVDLFAPATAR
jgi:hypothetical protein